MNGNGFGADQTGKEVHLVVDGRVTKVETRGSLLQEVLDEQAITLNPQDQVSMPLNGAIQDGDRIIIERAVPIQITVDSKTQTLFTTQNTVADVLKEAAALPLERQRENVFHERLRQYPLTATVTLETALATATTRPTALATNPLQLFHHPPVVLVSCVPLGLSAS